MARSEESAQKTEMSIARKAKICATCGEYKSHSEFHVNKSLKDGRHTYCKACRNSDVYQAKLLRNLEKGDTSIVECTQCYKLYTKSKTRTICLACFKTNNLNKKGTKNGEN